MAESVVKIEECDIDSELIFAEVEFMAVAGSHQARATVGVWVKNTDSRTELHKRAVAAAKEFLQQALLAVE